MGIRLRIDRLLLAAAPKLSVLILALVLFFAPFTHVFEKNEVFASDGGGSMALATKETVLDGIAWMAINLIIDVMAQQTIDWINSGFEGKPAFVQNPSEYLRGVADIVVGEIIYNELGLLCSPFKLDVQVSALLNYDQGRGLDVQCRLTDVIDNVDAFFAGDFLAGGWDGWYAMTQNPVNNPYGAKAAVEGHIAASIVNKQGERMRLLDQGRGFLSVEYCEPIEGNEATMEFHVVSPAVAKQNCEIVTPGVAIENRLNAALGYAENRLFVADEIMEIIGALLGQMVNQLFYGDKGGLVGLSQGHTARAGEFPQDNEGGYYYEEILGEPGEASAHFQFDTNCNEEGTSCQSSGSGSMNPPPDLLNGGGGGGSGGGGGGASNEMLWKPVSESDGRLVVLTPTSMGTPSVSVEEPSGATHGGRYAGHHNGNRAHYRFDRPGSGYAVGSLLVVNGVKYSLSNGPGQRNQGGDLIRVGN